MHLAHRWRLTCPPPPSPCAECGSQSAFNEDNNQTLFCVRSNHHILNSNIRALVYYTRWPANNDPVSDLKEAIEDLLRLLDIKIGHLENPGDYQCVVTTWHAKYSAVRRLTRRVWLSLQGHGGGARAQPPGRGACVGARGVRPAAFRRPGRCECAPRRACCRCGVPCLTSKPCFVQARERLQYVERTLPTLNLQQDHINNINTVLFRNKDKLEVLEARRAGAGVGAPPTQ